MFQEAWSKWRKDVGVVTSNFLSLSLLEGVNFALPLLTLPYVLRVLGPERFGLVALAQVVSRWFDIVVGYGFNLSATRSIARCREEPGERARLFTAVLACKLILILFTLGVLGALVATVQRFRDDADILWISYGLVLGNALTPTWYYQGTERMKPLVIASVTIRALVVVMIFVLIRTQDDYLLLPMMHSLGAIAVGLTTLFLAHSWYCARFCSVSIRDVVQQFREGGYIFLTHFVSAFYLYVPQIFLGVLHGNVAVGMYTPAQRVVGLMNRMVSPVIKSLFPFVTRVAASSENDGYSLVKAAGLGGTMLLLPVCSLLSCYSNEVIACLAGDQYPGASAVFRILIWVPVFNYVRRVVTVLGMTNFSQERVMFLVATIGLAGSVSIMFPLTVHFAETGTAVGMLITEGLISVCAATLFVRGFRRRAAARAVGVELQ